MATKITKTDRFNQISELLCRCVEEGLLTETEHEELAKFVSHEMELLAKKNASSGEKKLTKRQKSNADLKAMIYNIITLGGKQSYPTVYAQLTSDEEITAGRVTALLTQLVDEGKITRTKKGKGTFYEAVGV